MEQRKAVRRTLVALGVALISATGRAGSHSLAPFAGYVPTYEFFLGGAYFYEAEGGELGAEALLTFVDAYQLRTYGTWEAVPAARLKAEVNLQRGFDPYYGEGSDTVVVARRDVFGDRAEIFLEGERDVTKHLALGLRAEGRIRREERVKGSPGLRLFPDETTAGIGAYQRLDYRNSPDNPTGGFLQELHVAYYPGFLTSVAGHAGFGQARASFAWFQELFPDWVVGAHWEAGTSFGEPTYLFRYQLGGSEKLRGYHINRFRGKHFYLTQTELRFPLWRKLFNGGLFVGLGDISDGALVRARLSYGLGLRIGIPPDYVERARIDVGFGADQSGVFVDFGHAF